MHPSSKRPAAKSLNQIELENCLHILLQGIQDHSVIAEESAGEELRKELSALDGQFREKGDARQLVDSAVDTLTRYGVQASEVIARQKSGLAKAASELTAAINSLPESQAASDSLALLEEKIGSISAAGDLDAIKALLSADIAAARAEALQERQRVNSLFTGVITRLGLSSVQLSGEGGANEGPAYVPDRLTGLPSRAYAEAELTRAHQDSSECHMALFVVKRLALINARFGYSRGDQVLLKVVLHLAQSLPGFNNLFRWTPCAFLTIAPTSTTYQELRSKVQLIELTRMTPTLEWEGRSAMVPVALDCRIISAKDFEKPSELFLRLDTLASDV